MLAGLRAVLEVQAHVQADLQPGLGKCERFAVPKRRPKAVGKAPEASRKRSRSAKGLPDSVQEHQKAPKSSLGVLQECLKAPQERLKKREERAREAEKRRKASPREAQKSPRRVGSATREAFEKNIEKTYVFAARLHEPERYRRAPKI